MLNFMRQAYLVVCVDQQICREKLFVSASGLTPALKLFANKTSLFEKYCNLWMVCHICDIHRTNSYHSEHFICYLKSMPFFSGTSDYEAVVKLSDGFNGADLRNVCTEAGWLIKLLKDLPPCSQGKFTPWTGTVIKHHTNKENTQLLLTSVMNLRLRW